MSVVVERAKKCLDFTVTLYFLHLMFCWAYRGASHRGKECDVRRSDFPSTTHGGPLTRHLTPAGWPRSFEWWALNLVGLVMVAVFYVQAFASLWCVFASGSSLLILLHMVLRRRLPDADRLRGVRSLACTPPAEIDPTAVNSRN